MYSIEQYRDRDTWCDGEEETSCRGIEAVSYNQGYMTEILEKNGEGRNKERILKGFECVTNTR